MQIKPILTALRKHKLAMVLITLEIALACAVLCNASFMVADRFARMDLPAGVDESALGVIAVTGFKSEQAVDLNARMLAGLRAVPGVQSVSVINAVPFQGSGGLRMGIKRSADDKHHVGVPNFYAAGPGAFQALGLKLVAGRVPKAGDYRPDVAQLPVPNGSRVLVTRAFAQALWPGEKALGKEFWVGHMLHFRVIGVVAHFARPQPPGFQPGRGEWSIFVPVQPGPKLAGMYLIRATPETIDRVMVEARSAVRKIAPDVVLDHDVSHTLTTLRHDFFEADRAMSGLLIGVIVALLLVTALGIVGLASFWVAQRRKQIGVRRALGATRGDILRYFQTENFLIVTFGIAMGVILAYAINVTLMQYYGLSRLPPWYLGVGAVALWLLGQLAVLAPALRASRVPPVVATRSV